MRFIYSETCQIKHARGEKFNITIDKVLNYTVQKQIQEVKLEWKSISDNTVIRITQVRIRQVLLYYQ